MVFHHDFVAADFEASEVAALVDELRVNVLVDAGHTKNVPAVIDVEKDVSIEVFIILPFTVATVYDFTLVDCDFISGVFDFHALFFGWFESIWFFLSLVLFHDIAYGSLFSSSKGVKLFLGEFDFRFQELK